MGNGDSFELLVKTTGYKDGIRTLDSGTIDGRDSGSLGRLSEALYVSAYNCAERHADLMAQNMKRKESGDVG